MLLSIHEESHSQRSSTDQRQDAHLPLTGENPRKAACHCNPAKPEHNPPGEEWTDAGFVRMQGNAAGVCVCSQLNIASPPPLLTLDYT